MFQCFALGNLLVFLVAVVIFSTDFTTRLLCLALAAALLRPAQRAAGKVHARFLIAWISDQLDFEEIEAGKPQYNDRPAR